MTIQNYLSCSSELEDKQAIEGFTSMDIIGVPVTAISFEKQIDLMLFWAQHRFSKSVCVANVHMLMESHWDPNFRKILQSSDLVTPDGMPLVRMMQFLGESSQDRVAGFDIFQALCQRAPQFNVSIFLLGSDQKTLDLIRERLKVDYPQLTLAGARPLPFKKKLTNGDNQPAIDEINQSGAGLVLVALGCPKQERWIADNKNSINATMLGLGYVFEVYGGVHKRAPQWIQDLSLEWLFRLTQEPKRLWKRYVITIPPFLFLACSQLIAHKVNQWRLKITKN